MGLIVLLCFSSVLSKGDVSEKTVAAVIKIEAALGNFSDGPFFLGQFSLVDIAYVPFIERIQTALSGLKNYDIAKGRMKLDEITCVHIVWKEANKIEAYTQTKEDQQLVLDQIKEKFGIA